MVEPRRSRIVVVGAGPVGLAVAARLASGEHAERFEIHVFDAAPEPIWTPERMDLRVYALSRASQGLLERLGLWHRVLAARACAYRRMRVWQGERADADTAITFDSADIGEPDLGHIVEDSLLRRTLLDYVRTCPRAHVVTDTAIEGVRVRDRGVDLDFAGGQRLTADLLVAADGGASRVRTLLDLPVAVRDYAQHAIVTHVVSEASHRETAWQRFLPDGPLALLPLTDGRSSVVWSLPSERAARLTAAADDEFLAELDAASGATLGRLGPCTERVNLPLRLLHAFDYTRRRVALVGDAAHCVHPLAGQGMNLGMLDAAVLADEIERGVSADLGVGDPALLGRYERRRKGHNVQMMLAFDALDRLFRLPNWAAPARGLGLALIDRAMPAKRALMSRALGLA
jgi:2-octaprenylphenol hydroxylase